ncbi:MULTISPECIES: hypothetical protein [Agrobacterium]|uniref:hypothetical protein n=1 Tax=Agrobacterium TaxID=357 RepID=UPI0009C74BB3|nr:MULTISPECIES: hypothetical protein [Agrobacterium]CUX44808.1 hypothetical protein AGR7B_Lc40117 [Agrobacterium deltaense RV3]
MSALSEKMRPAGGFANGGVCGSGIENGPSAIFFVILCFGPRIHDFNGLSIPA